MFLGGEAKGSHCEGEADPVWRNLHLSCDVLQKGWLSQGVQAGRMSIPLWLGLCPTLRRGEVSVISWELEFLGVFSAQEAGAAELVLMGVGIKYQ